MAKEETKSNNVAKKKSTLLDKQVAIANKKQKASMFQELEKLDKKGELTK